MGPIPASVGKPVVAPPPPPSADELKSKTPELRGTLDSKTGTVTFTAIPPGTTADQLVAYLSKEYPGVFEGMTKGQTAVLCAEMQLLCDKDKKPLFVDGKFRGGPVSFEIKKLQAMIDHAKAASNPDPAPSAPAVSGTKAPTLPAAPKIAAGDVLSPAQAMAAADELHLPLSSRPPSVEDRMQIQSRVMTLQALFGSLGIPCSVNGKWDGATQSALQAFRDKFADASWTPKPGQDTVAMYLEKANASENKPATTESYGASLKPDAQGKIDEHKGTLALTGATKELSDPNTTPERKAEIIRDIAPNLDRAIQQSNDRSFLQKILDFIVEAFGGAPSEAKQLGELATNAKKKLTEVRAKLELGEGTTIAPSRFNEAKAAKPDGAPVFDRGSIALLGYATKRAELVAQWQKAPANSPEAAKIRTEIVVLDKCASDLQLNLGGDFAKFQKAVTDMEGAVVSVNKRAPELAVAASAVPGKGWEISPGDFTKAKDAAKPQDLSTTQTIFGDYKQTRTTLAARLQSLPAGSPERAILTQQIATLDAHAASLQDNVAKVTTGITDKNDKPVAEIVSSGQALRTALDGLHVQANGVSTPDAAVALFMGSHKAFVAELMNGPPKRTEAEVRLQMTAHWVARGSIPVSSDALATTQESFVLPSIAETRAMFAGGAVPPRLTAKDRETIAAFNKNPQSKVGSNVLGAEQAKTMGFDVDMGVTGADPARLRFKKDQPLGIRTNQGLFETAVVGYMGPMTRAEIFASPELRQAWAQWQAGGPVYIPTTITLGGTYGANTMEAHGYSDTGVMDIDAKGNAVSFYQTPDGKVHVKAVDKGSKDITPEAEVDGWQGLQQWLLEHNYVLPPPTTGKVEELN